MGVPVELRQAELEAITDPAALLDHSWELEPWGRYDERDAALDRLEALLHAGDLPAAPPGRDWRLELMAERAIDVGRSRRLEESLALAEQVVAEADASLEIALSRAMLARGQAWAWYGTDEATREANRAFAEAAQRFAALGRRDWQGSALLRRGYSACYQYGDILLAEALISQALETYEPGSDRLPGALASYADVLIDLGEYDRANLLKLEYDSIIDSSTFAALRYYNTWTKSTTAPTRCSIVPPPRPTGMGFRRPAATSPGAAPGSPPDGVTRGRQSACCSRPSARFRNWTGSRRTSAPRSCWTPPSCSTASASVTRHSATSSVPASEPEIATTRSCKRVR